MVILVLNCGSSSIKYQVIDMEAASSKLLAKGIVERIGLPEGDLTHKPVGKEPFELHRPIPDHTTGIKLVLDALTDPAHGVIGSLDEGKAAAEVAEPDVAEMARVPREVLMRFIGELPEGYRAVFNLYCIEEYSHRDIARMLGINEKSSSSQLFRARAMLARRIRAYLETH